MRRKNKIKMEYMQGLYTVMNNYGKGKWYLVND